MTGPADGTYRELLLGCGYTRDKRISTAEFSEANRARIDPLSVIEPWRDLYTLDCNLRCKADIYCDLARGFWEPFKYSDHGSDAIDHRPPVTLKSNFFDEIHAYEVLEHLGAQGDVHLFMAQFTNLWDMLKPDGLLCATVPSRWSEWVWGDPSHTRVILPQSLLFLQQPQYVLQCDGPKPTGMSDFRDFYKADFDLLAANDNRRNFSFVLRAIKPSRCTLK